MQSQKLIPRNPEKENKNNDMPRQMAEILR